MNDRRIGVQEDQGFRSQDQQDKYLQIYDRLVETHWPVPCEEIDVESRFGTTRVRVSGECEGLPLLLLHPTMGSSVGWYPLIAQLCTERKVYTPDTIGGAGRSIQTEPMATGDDLVACKDLVA